MKLNRKRVPISDFGIFYYLKVELIPSLIKVGRLNFSSPLLRGPSMEDRQSP